MILIGGNGDTVFARLAETMGRPDLAADPRYATHAARGENQLELDAIIAGWTTGFSLADLLALLEEKGIPSGRVFRAPDMLADPQFQSRDAIVETDHPVFGRVRWPGPGLGEHTAEVLGEIGIEAARAAALKARGVVGG